MQAKELGTEEGFGRNPGVYHSKHASSTCSRMDWKSTSTSDEDALTAPVPSSSASNSTEEEIIKEIAHLDFAIEQLEQYVLTLYRSAFGQYLGNSTFSNYATYFDAKLPDRFMLKDDPIQRECSDNMLSLGGCASTDSTHPLEASQTFHQGNSNKRLDGFRHSVSSPIRDLDGHVCSVSSSENSSYGLVKSCSSHRTLADHLCASITQNVAETPCKLSEDIIKCISAVYIKLNHNTVQLPSMISSPVSSLSSSSTFSPRDCQDNWSPQCESDLTESPCQLEMSKGINTPYGGMAEISKISIDKDRFNSAAALLEGHRSLVRRLETVNPSKLDHEEKLAFWINIHNAIVMHAFIAYGLENNHIRSTPAVVKKSYNVGGENFNAYKIQCSIFGCRTHCPELNKRSLLSPSTKFVIMGGKNVHALDHSEPLVHFALSLGTCSDPPVRLYTAKNVMMQLQLAKEEFIQANVLMHKESRIMLPKILEYYAKDAFLDLPAVVKIALDCLTESKRKVMQECIKGKLDKRIQWLPYKSNFRYILHRDLDLIKQ